METGYEINMDDYDSADYVEYSEEYYSREVYLPVDYPSRYWYAEV